MSTVEETLAVEGMTCQGCVRSVTRAVAAVPGVEAVTVDLEARRATVRFDPSRVTTAQVRAAIEDAGFDAP